MRTVSQKWYIRQNRAISFFSLILIALYALSEFAGIGVGFEITTPAFFFAGATLIYTLIGFRFVSKKTHRIASLVGLVLFAMSGIAQLSIGQLNDPVFVAVWLIAILLGGMFGIYVLGSLRFTDTAYFILIATSDSKFLENTTNIAIFITAFVATSASYLAWRKAYTVGESDKQVLHLNSRLSQEQYKSEILIQSMGDGVIVTDNEGKVLIMNTAAQGLTGWNRDDATGLDYQVVVALTDSEGKELGESDPFVQAFSTNQSVVSNEFNLKPKDGEPKVISIIVSPLIGESDRADGVIAVMRDVSKEKIAERQRAEFISTASHEMRTPVAAIEGYLALAMNPKVTKIDEKAKQYLEKAHTSTQHLGQLFQDLLSAAKSEDGRLSNHPVVTEVGSLLETIVEEMRFTAEKKGLALEFNTTGDNLTPAKVIKPILFAHVDPERIREAMSNLISNAIKFTNEGRVTVSLKSSDDAIFIQVIDTGVGIPQEDIPHLFQKFYRVDNSATRTIGGTGLGLFISRNIIELYNGKIWVESEYGKGTTFNIQLPRLNNTQVQELQRHEQQAQVTQDQQAAQHHDELQQRVNNTANVPPVQPLQPQQSQLPQQSGGDQVVATNTSTTV